MDTILLQSIRFIRTLDLWLSKLFPKIFYNTKTNYKILQMNYHTPKIQYDMKMIKIGVENNLKFLHLRILSLLPNINQY